MGLPDPFARILVEGTTQEYTTEICKASLDPRWNSHYDLFLGKNDNIIISIYNHRKLHKRQAFLGCVRIVASGIQLLRDTGCKYLLVSLIGKILLHLRQQGTSKVSFGVCDM
uniref:C2 domain-containing protein n=1 Tax=Anopheles culicifacies TaxID=139723 RepID=A0A182MIF4_9DIPT